MASNRFRLKEKTVDAYHFIVTLPDRCYPFRNEIEGQWVRGMRSYDAAVAAYQKQFNTTRISYKLAAYRQIFHLLGSVLVLTVATFLSHRFFGSDIALFVVLAFGIIFVTYQEFALQPRTYGQHWQKGVADWLVWFIPAGIYLSLIAIEAN